MAQCLEFLRPSCGSSSSRHLAETGFADAEAGEDGGDQASTVWKALVHLGFAGKGSLCGCVLQLYICWVQVL